MDDTGTPQKRADFLRLLPRSEMPLTEDGLAPDLIILDPYRGYGREQPQVLGAALLRGGPRPGALLAKIEARCRWASMNAERAATKPTKDGKRAVPVRLIVQSPAGPNCKENDGIPPGLFLVPEDEWKKLVASVRRAGDPVLECDHTCGGHGCVLTNNLGDMLDGAHIVRSGDEVTEELARFTEEVGNDGFLSVLRDWAAEHGEDGEPSGATDREDDTSGSTDHEDDDPPGLAAAGARAVGTEAQLDYEASELASAFAD